MALAVMVSIGLLERRVDDSTVRLTQGVALPFLHLAHRLEQEPDPHGFIESTQERVGETLAIVPKGLVLERLSTDEQQALLAGEVVISGPPEERYAYAQIDGRDEALEFVILGATTAPVFWHLLPRGPPPSAGGLGKRPRRMGRIEAPDPRVTDGCGDDCDEGGDEGPGVDEGPGRMTKRGRRGTKRGRGRGRYGDGPWIRVEDVPGADAISDLDRARAAWRTVRVGQLLIRERGGELVARVAPMPRAFSDDHYWLMRAALFLLFALVLFLILRPLHRELRTLTVVAKQFEDGALDSRVPVDTRDVFQELARSFNTMATRVEHLISENTELMQAVSHELRTPIARLLFSLDLLDGMEDDNKRAELIETMRAGTLEIADLTKELMDFHRIGETMSAEGWVEVDLTEIVDDVAAEVEGTRVVRADAAATVWGDPRLLFRAIQNLASNAVRYATPPTLKVEARGDMWAIVVDDEGRGIAVADEERVFVPFVRLERSRSRATGGTGLGLAIVQRIARRHQGRCSLERKATRGARFVFEIPRFNPDKAHEAEADNAAPS